MNGVLKCHWAQSVRKRTGSNSALHVKTVQENIRTPKAVKNLGVDTCKPASSVAAW